MFHSDDPVILLSLILQLGIIVFLLRGAFRKYHWVLAYSLTRLITTVLEVGVRQNGGNETLFFRQVYYSDRVILNLVLFVMVSAIIYRLLEGKPHRSTIGKVLIGIVAAVLLLPFLVLSRPFTIHWLNGMSQFLYFGSGIMTLVLWTVLMSSNPRDSQLLRFTIGLGVAMSGAAITFGLHPWIGSRRLEWMPNLFLRVTHITGLLIWCWAFRPATRQTNAPPNAVTSH
jgi:hypothetical protein